MSSISVVMPLLNGMPLLQEQLDALRGQDWSGEWELIIADNGCSDGSLGAARAAGFPCLSIADATDRRGISHARNVGVTLAQGTHVMFCDADDTVDPGWLTQAAHAFETADFIGGRLRVDRLNPRTTLETRTSPADVALPIAMGHVPYAVGANFGMLRKAFLSLGGCDERFAICGDDVDLSWRAGAAGLTPTWAPEVVVDYRFRSGMRSLWTQQRNYGEAYTLIQKVHGAEQPPLITARQAAAEWLTLMTHPQMLVRGRRARADFVRSAAFRVGRARGSLRHRVFSP